MFEGEGLLNLRKLHLSDLTYTVWAVRFEVKKQRSPLPIGAGESGKDWLASPPVVRTSPDQKSLLAVQPVHASVCISARILAPRDPPSSSAEHLHYGTR
jgi:hypothetical protein